MRRITAEEITEKVRALCIDACVNLGAAEEEALRDALGRETSPTGRDVLKKLLENADAARDGNIPLCQDTGSAVFFIEVGQDVQVTAVRKRDQFLHHGRPVGQAGSADHAQSRMLEYSAFAVSHDHVGEGVKIHRYKVQGTREKGKDRKPVNWSQTDQFRV